MPNRPSTQVYGLGQCALDILGKIDAYPPPDVKCEFSGMVIQGGGPVATALVALSRWGLSCAFSGILGDDLFGQMTKASLDEEGVNTGGLLVREGFKSQFAFIVAEPGTGRRTIFWQRPTGPPPNPDEIDYALIRQARVVLTDGLFPEAALAACKKRLLASMDRFSSISRLAHSAKALILTCSSCAACSNRRRA